MTLTPGYAVGAVVTGVLLGLVGAVVASARVVVGGVTVPWGAVLAVAALVAAVRATVWTAGTRRAGTLVMLGWLLATVAVLTVSPGGDVLLPDLPRTWGYLVAAVLLGVPAAWWPLPRGHHEVVGVPSSDEPSGQADGVR